MRQHARRRVCAGLLETTVSRNNLKRAVEGKGDLFTIKHLNLTPCTHWPQCDSKLCFCSVWHSQTLVRRAERVRHIGESCKLARPKFDMACGIHIDNSMTWHATYHMACCMHNTYRFGLCADRPARPASGRRPTSRALHMCARGMACCMCITHTMENGACMPNTGHGNCRRPSASFPGYRRFQRFLGNEAERPDACHAA